MSMTAREAWRALDADFHHQDSIWRAYAALSGLSDTAFLILCTLRIDGEGQTQNRIAAHWHLAPQSVNSAVRRLTELGYLHLKKQPGSGNSKTLHLTPDGRRFCRGLVDALRRAEEEALAQLSPDELELYIALTRRIASAVESSLRRASARSKAPRKEES